MHPSPQLPFVTPNNDSGRTRHSGRKSRITLQPNTSIPTLASANELHMHMRTQCEVADVISMHQRPHKNTATKHNTRTHTHLVKNQSFDQTTLRPVNPFDFRGWRRHLMCVCTCTCDLTLQMRHSCINIRANSIHRRTQSEIKLFTITITSPSRLGDSITT